VDAQAGDSSSERANAQANDGPGKMSVRSLRDHVAASPGALYPGSWILEELETECSPPALEPVQAVSSWRERLWSCDPATRLGIEEAAEALGRPRGWIYQRCCKVTPKARERAAKRGGRVPDRIPHRKQDGALVFVAGELRDWLQQQEDVVIAAPRNVRAVR